MSHESFNVFSVSKPVSVLAQGSTLNIKIHYTPYPLRSVDRRYPPPPILQMRKLGVREME